MKRNKLKTIFTSLLVMLMAMPPLFADAKVINQEIPGAQQPGIALDEAKVKNMMGQKNPMPKQEGLDEFMAPLPLSPMVPAPGNADDAMNGGRMRNVDNLPKDGAIPVYEAMNPVQSLTDLKQQWLAYQLTVKFQLIMLENMEKNLYADHDASLQVDSLLNNLLGAIENAETTVPIPGVNLITGDALISYENQRIDLGMKIDTASAAAEHAIIIARARLSAEKDKITEAMTTIDNAMLLGGNIADIPRAPTMIPNEVMEKIMEAGNHLSQFNAHWGALKSLARMVISRVNQIVYIFNLFGIALNASQQAVVTAAEALRSFLVTLR